jgi:hypothetical protein
MDEEMERERVQDHEHDEKDGASMAVTDMIHTSTDDAAAAAAFFFLAQPRSNPLANVLPSLEAIRIDIELSNGR